MRVDFGSYNLRKIVFYLVVMLKLEKSKQQVWLRFTETMCNNYVDLLLNFILEYYRTNLTKGVLV